VSENPKPAPVAPENLLRARGIRSYVLRRSHFSAAQRDAYERLMPVYGIGFTPELLDFAAVFGRDAPRVLEIGFGMGETTAEIAAANPQIDYLGVEVHTPGVGALLKRVESQGLANVRVIEHDAQDVVRFQIPDGFLTGIHVFFPDPWPKARHHKRRLLQAQFVTKLAAKLLPGGYLHVATDWPDYAEQMTLVLAATPGLGHARPRNGAAEAVFGPDAGPARPPTKFERRGVALGHPISDLVRYRIGDPL
jgi:tRNA (guanine-N7-)-methyltransferase